MMAEQVRRAVAWVYAMRRSSAATRTVSTFRPFIGRPSAGVVLVTDWQKEFDLLADTVKGGLLCSGMLRSETGAALRARYLREFTDEMEHALRPAPPRQAQLPLVVAHGTLETARIQRQTRDFAAAVKADGETRCNFSSGRAKPLRRSSDARQSLRPPRRRCAQSR